MNPEDEGHRISASTAPPPLVSVICTTYRHAPYLAQALDGILQQRTDFPVEVIVHDDASPDGTPEIVRRYAAAHPTKIRPILQAENQLSQGRRPMLLCLPSCQGEFMALCEGDDYWTDPDKLQRQVTALRKYPDCDLCIHPALATYEDGRRLPHRVGWHGEQERVIPFEDWLKTTGGICPTASVFLRRRAVENPPAWLARVPVGDFFLQLLGARQGGGVYIPQTMAVYRRFAAGSHMQRMEAAAQSQASQNEAIQMMRRRISIMAEVQDWLPARYGPDVAAHVHELQFGLAKAFLRAGDIDGFREVMSQLQVGHPDLRRWDRWILMHVARRTPRLARSWMWAGRRFKSLLVRRRRQIQAS